MIVGGELAKLAFDYMKANSPDHVKKDAASAWNTAVQGRFQAFKNWCVTAWSGETTFDLALGDYMDYLALFEDRDQTPKPSFKEFYEATRAPSDLGEYTTFKVVMNAMGAVADKRHFIEIRQQGRHKTSAPGGGDWSLSTSQARVHSLVT